MIKEILNGSYIHVSVYEESDINRLVSQIGELDGVRSIDVIDDIKYESKDGLVSANIYHALIKELGYAPVKYEIEYRTATGKQIPEVVFDFKELIEKAYHHPEGFKLVKADPELTDSQKEFLSTAIEEGLKAKGINLDQTYWYTVLAYDTHEFVDVIYNGSSEKEAKKAAYKWLDSGEPYSKRSATIQVWRSGEKVNTYHMGVLSFS